MPPRLSTLPLQPFLTRNNALFSLRASFSASTRKQADDPYSSLEDLLTPANTRRPQQNSAPSRSPASALGADSSNPFLLEIPPAAPLPRSSRPAGVSESRWQDTNRRTRTDTSRPPAPSPSTESPSDDGIATFFKTVGRATQEKARQESARKAQNVQIRQVENQASRTWRDGDVYAPHDLSPVEMQKARQAKYRASSSNLPLNSRKKGGRDVLDDLGIDPLKEYKNFAMMGEYMTDLGRIRHSRETGLRAVNQRRMAKALRRAIGIGIMPSVHRHPELMPARVEMREKSKG